MGNNDKHFWGSREQRKNFRAERNKLKTFLGRRGYINRERGIKSKRIKGSRQHVPPLRMGSLATDLIKWKQDNLNDQFAKIGQIITKKCSPPPYF